MPNYPTILSLKQSLYLIKDKSDAKFINLRNNQSRLAKTTNLCGKTRQNRFRSVIGFLLMFGLKIKRFNYTDTKVSGIKLLLIKKIVIRY